MRRRVTATLTMRCLKPFACSAACLAMAVLTYLRVAHTPGLASSWSASRPGCACLTTNGTHALHLRHDDYGTYSYHAGKIILRSSFCLQASDATNSNDRVALATYTTNMQHELQCEICAARWAYARAHGMAYCQTATYFDPTRSMTHNKLLMIAVVALHYDLVFHVDADAYLAPCARLVPPTWFLIDASADDETSALQGAAPAILFSREPCKGSRHHPYALNAGVARYDFTQVGARDGLLRCYNDYWRAVMKAPYSEGALLRECLRADSALASATGIAPCDSFAVYRSEWDPIWTNRHELNAICVAVHAAGSSPMKYNRIYPDWHGVHEVTRHSRNLARRLHVGDAHWFVLRSHASVIHHTSLTVSWRRVVRV